ncbi:DUF2497 domain-containing protein [Qipengyuania sp. DSG2-2]|uniref:DUF2497 domain-containing protein n=1 Tax=Qipengyuania sp. DGS2-2 TaxID=3349631 RepID=UPI0036D2F39D
MPQPGESSVEEILESIKKVIARDNRAMAAEARVRRERAADEQDPPEPVVQEEADEVLDLDDAMVEGELVEEELVESGDVEAGEDFDANADALLTDAASEAMRDNLAALAMMATPPAAPQIVRSGETSLEGLVREMLRPMLAEWLDANLPGMVEKMVQAEISRIAGKKG